MNTAIPTDVNMWSTKKQKDVITICYTNVKWPPLTTAVLQTVFSWILHTVFPDKPCFLIKIANKNDTICETILSGSI